MITAGKTVLVGFSAADVAREISDRPDDEVMAKATREILRTFRS